MKFIAKRPEPGCLTSFNHDNPYSVGSHNAQWGLLKALPEYQTQIVDPLLFDQGHLCAYCENSILRRDGIGGIQDIGIEHFHPKSSNEGGHPWVSRWSNLFAVCLGGSNANVVDPDERFGDPEKELSCDKKKENKVLDETILNPLQIPSEYCLFTFHRSNGKLSVNGENCRAAGVDVNLVEQSIEELNLNAVRLCRARSRVLTEVNNLIRKLVEEGSTLAEAREKMARVRLVKKENTYFPFFTACRSYLGAGVEKILLIEH